MNATCQRCRSRRSQNSLVIVELKWLQFTRRTPNTSLHTSVHTFTIFLDALVVSIVRSYGTKHRAVRQVEKSSLRCVVMCHPSPWIWIASNIFPPKKNLLHLLTIAHFTIKKPSPWVLIHHQLRNIIHQQKRYPRLGTKSVVIFSSQLCFSDEYSIERSAAQQLVSSDIWKTWKWEYIKDDELVFVCGVRYCGMLWAAFYRLNYLVGPAVSQENVASLRSQPSYLMTPLERSAWEAHEKAAVRPWNREQHPNTCWWQLCSSVQLLRKKKPSDCAIVFLRILQLLWHRRFFNFFFGWYLLKLFLIYVKSICFFSMCSSFFP